MKKIYVLLLLCGIYSITQNSALAQNVANFEELTLASESYYDGSSDHSETLYETEIFSYTTGGATFSVSSSFWGAGTFAFSGMAYSNQTDQTTASYTNFSAYSSPAGGANGSANYGIFYSGSDSITFTEAVDLNSIFITNHVWAYHYIMGTDGSGSGTFEDGDFLKLKIKGFSSSKAEVGEVIVDLADYTNGNSTVINNWTEVDLTSLAQVTYIKFSISSSDDWAPLYFCMDDLSYTTTSTEFEANFDVPSVMCSGTAIEFTNSSIGTSVNTEYHWSVDNVEQSTNEDFSYTLENLTADETHSIKLKIVDGDQIDSIINEITVHPTPTVSVATDNESVCNGTEIVINATGADSYLWNTTETGSSLTVTVESTTTYIATGTDANGCSADAEIEITALESPEVFTVSGGGNINDGQTVNVNLSGSQVGVSYHLMRESYEAAVLEGTGEALVFENINEDGMYTIKAIHSNTNCEEIMDGEAEIIINALDELQSNTISIYPNPFIDEITINGMDNGNYIIQNIEGKVVTQGRIELNESINVQDLQSGVYFIELSNGGERIVKKIIK